MTEVNERATWGCCYEIDGVDCYQIRLPFCGGAILPIQNDKRLINAQGPRRPHPLISRTPNQC